jgi:transposase
MAAKVFQESGRSVRSLARDLRCDESTLRYRLGRLKSGTPDGRRRQPEACAPWDRQIREWMEAQEEAERPAPVEELHEELVMLGFTGSYQAVRRYVRRRQPVPKRRPRRRVEVKPGSQGQVDWIERKVRLESHGGEWVTVYGFLMVLGFSRMWHLVWSLSQDFAAWIGCHNAALARLGGVPWTLRPDNLKTAVKSGGGPTAVLHDGYSSWADQVGTVIDPARVRTPTDKGKVERRARDVESYVDLEVVYVDLAHLQVATEQGIVRRAQALVHPLLGGDLLAAWRFEQVHLLALPAVLPRPFDVEVRRRADGDGMVSFEGRRYHVPLAAIDREVLVRGCGDEVELVVDGERVAVYPRHTRCRRLVRQAFYDGPGTETVTPAVPLGEVGRWIAMETSWEYEAAARGIDRYAALVGGAP